MGNWDVARKCGMALITAVLCGDLMGADESSIPDLPPAPPSLPDVRATRRTNQPASRQPGVDRPAIAPGAWADTNTLRSNYIRGLMSLTNYPRPGMVGTPRLGLGPAATNLGGAARYGLRSNLYGTNLARSTTSLLQEKVFAWDALVREHNAKTGELTTSFTFAFTNTAETNVTINYIRSSCGCTVVKLPGLPWNIPAGSSNAFEVVADLRGKHGVLTKTITVDTSAGFRWLTVRISIPASPAVSTSLADRARNMQISMGDRQAIFRGDCARCHISPSVAKTGEELYVLACGVCHEADHRASMVPNLRALNRPPDRAYWENWISKGKETTLMPAWAITEGGNLTEDQIKSLVDLLTGPYLSQPLVTNMAAQAEQQKASTQ